MKYVLIAIIILTANGHLRAQSVSLSSGIAGDINNPGKSFYFIPVRMEWQPDDKKIVSIFVQYDAGLNANAKVPAYTLSPSLPPEIMLTEKIKFNILTVGVSFYVNLIKTNQEGSFGAYFLPFGISYQYFRVSYPSFDKQNYTLLNPDVKRKNSGPVTGIGLFYRFDRQKMVSFSMQGNLFPTRPRDFNYNYAVPARLMFTWSYPYKK